MESDDFGVSGRGKEVFFRASTQAGAQEPGLTGWVPNGSDGRVELEASGDTGRYDLAGALPAIGTTSSISCETSSSRLR